MRSRTDIEEEKEALFWAEKWKFMVELATTSQEEFERRLILIVKSKQPVDQEDSASCIIILIKQ